jgi:hypothetical protein
MEAVFAGQPFEADEQQLDSDIERYIDVFIAGLQSFFVVMPRGEAFVEFERFKKGYDCLRRWSGSFDKLSEEVALAAVEEDPLALVVLRTMTGLSAPELGHLACGELKAQVDQSAARRVDRRAREDRAVLSRVSPKTRECAEYLVRMAVALLKRGATKVGPEAVHRLDKIDTRSGLRDAEALAVGGVPYESLLYERLLGRPFATHRDAVSGKVGEVLEEAVEAQLRSSAVLFHKAGVGERFEDMDQAPDFAVPHVRSPAVVIEAKLAEDDGTARDKVTRVQHLAELRDRRVRQGVAGFEVIACVDGRGFGIRREDVRKLLRATRGKLFTLGTIESLVGATSLKLFRG